MAKHVGVGEGLEDPRARHARLQRADGDLLCALAFDHQPVGHARGLLAGAAMGVYLAVAQIPHVAQHRDARPVAEQRQHVQRGADRGRTGVDRVVEDQRVVAGGQRAQVAGLWFHVGQRRDDLMGRHAEPGPGSDSRQQQRHVVAAQQRCDDHARQLNAGALDTGAEPVVHHVEGKPLRRDGDVARL